MPGRATCFSRLFALFLFAFGDGEFVFGVDVVAFEFGEEACVGQIERMGMLPIVAHDFDHALDDVFVADVDGEFAAAIEAAGREIDGADDDAFAVNEQHLGVKLEMLKLVNLDSDDVHYAKAANSFGELLSR